MARRSLPEPEHKSIFFRLGLAVVLFSVGFMAVVTALGWWWLSLLTVPGLFPALLWLMVKQQLWEASRRRLAAIVLTSDSPHWQDYIASHWCARFGTDVAVLNWSVRKDWPNSLEVWLVQHYLGSDRAFCPAVLVLRGTRHPLVFRFYQPFRDFRHGRTLPLRRLEQRMFAELGIDVSELPDFQPEEQEERRESSPV